MRSVLESTGGIYPRCGRYADAYIRVYVLSKIFGENNFRTENIIIKLATFDETAPLYAVYPKIFGE